MALIRILGIVLLIYLFIKLMTRIVFPLAARYFMRKASQNIEEKMRSQSQGQKIYQDEKVTIRKPSGTANNGPAGNDGEYVEYEEV